VGGMLMRFFFVFLLVSSSIFICVLELLIDREK